uniref:SET domain-containing protein n=1 Tax=Cyprinus carpio carpio TaxID=630221 RepID=A0A8C1D4R9_CYPCA
MNANTAFYLLKMSHPVTVHAAPPERAARVQISRQFESDCHSLWCVTQKKLHERLVLGKSLIQVIKTDILHLDSFGPRQPSESKVHSWIEKQGWMENVPDAAEVVKDWKPPRSIQAPTDSKSIRRMSRRQCWKGLQLMDREGKGLRVVTSRPFACGEVICDFHGRLISRDEGLEIQQSNQTQAGHLFFFTSKNGQDMCLDAHEERCECHPNKTTFGRQMKHSVTRANLSPRLHFVEDEPLILFMATRDIQTGEELRYDYGDNRRSYAFWKMSIYGWDLLFLHLYCDNK